MLRAKYLKKIIADSGIGIENVMTSTIRPTVSKTRVMSGNQQIVRIDDESALHSLLKKTINY